MQVTILVLLVVNLLLMAVVTLFVIRSLKQKNDFGAQGEMQSMRVDLRELFAGQRTELTQYLSVMQTQLDGRIRASSEAQAQELAREREARAAANRELRELLDRSLNEQLATTLKVSLEDNSSRIQKLTESNATKQEEMRKSMQEALERLRDGNEKKLEQMRITVDEKLQGTLEKRLGESFSLVSERLEQVQKGLGEMQTLASDVGGLKRVLTNVKNRGGWGEVQLARQLEDMLTAEQYAVNVAIKPNTQDRVEFAIILPGSDANDRPVYLPIDSKFPQEDYERLLDAQDAGEKEDVDRAIKNIERVITEQAKLISSKYVEPPYSTDFAIMYLPTEGLFAEVVRRPGLTSRLQNEQRVLVTGPTTLMSLLNSLQMGFRTLAIEKRSSEVWQVLSAAKTEFEKYGVVWERLERQLKSAQNTVKAAGTRTRALQRKLKDVETLSVGNTTEVLGDYIDTVGETDTVGEIDTVGEESALENDDDLEELSTEEVSAE
ncbi:MAG TPA: DNA recombination protein RmuC [Microbacteriaceae bacterium]|nr:DNA recombination protein RmuC [Microbacteriaceae bacterium]